MGVRVGSWWRGGGITGTGIILWLRGSGAGSRLCGGGRLCGISCVGSVGCSREAGPVLGGVLCVRGIAGIRCSSACRRISGSVFRLDSTVT
jgi:hypothetical protein